jgi:hypothetical protein
VTYDLAARVTQGMAMPYTGDKTDPAGVVLLQGEDNLATTVRPRLAAAGADLNRVLAYDKALFGARPLVLPADLAVIEQAVIETRARLVVIDPLAAFLPGPASSEKVVRQALAPLAAYAERAGVAVVLVRHLLKSGSTKPIYRGAGSIAVIGYVCAVAASACAA